MNKILITFAGFPGKPKVWLTTAEFSALINDPLATWPELRRRKVQPCDDLPRRLAQIYSLFLKGGD